MFAEIDLGLSLNLILSLSLKNSLTSSFFIHSSLQILCSFQITNPKFQIPNNKLQMIINQFPMTKCVTPLEFIVYIVILFYNHRFAQILPQTNPQRRVITERIFSFIFFLKICDQSVINLWKSVVSLLINKPLNTLFKILYIKVYQQTNFCV